ncbi:MAG TPA: bile acid:sodium symporter family protein [Stenotrophobium sp.]|jgi:sodium/bile acid cotransporter 7|nr:bile acid:sodium symporter family protein [Stenotrophobium sp.]
MNLSRLLPDRFTLSLIATVGVASLLPCRGMAASAFDVFTNIAIALLFFLHGTRLSRQAIVNGATHWRLHLLVVASSFAFFPLMALALKPVLAPLVTPGLYAGVIIMCTMPSTVQSSIAFTSIARGNISAAVCSASLSSLLGVFLTPLLVGLLLMRHQSESSSLHAVFDIVMQLLVPFIAGHLSQRWIGEWVGRHGVLVGAVDRGSILLVVYTAFSEAVVEGLWHQVTPDALLGLLLVTSLMLALALMTTTFAARGFGFGKEDEIAIVFCGSKKSLASGLPMIKVIFAGQAIGVAVLPLMLFHQIQLMVCAVLAQRYAERKSPGAHSAES